MMRVGMMREMVQQAAGKNSLWSWKFRKYFDFCEKQSEIVYLIMMVLNKM